MAGVLPLGAAFAGKLPGLGHDEFARGWNWSVSVAFGGYGFDRHNRYLSCKAA